MQHTSSRIFLFYCAHWSNGMCTSGQLSDGTCTSGHLSDGTCTSGQLSDGMCTSGHLSDGMCTSGHLSNGTCTSGHLSNGTCTSGQLTNGTCTSGICCYALGGCWWLRRLSGGLEVISPRIESRKPRFFPCTPLPTQGTKK